MEADKLYQPEVLRQKVPTLHPRYQWMDIELEPDDRVVLTTINGHAAVEAVTELSDLSEDSVARVILKLVGRGVVLFDDDLPFYDEDEVLRLVPAFDPNDTNRDANLDDSDRMLLTLINGRTSVGQMEAALPLSRGRLIASVLRLSLADVITFEETPPEPPQAASVKASARADAPASEVSPEKAEAEAVAPAGDGPRTDAPTRFRNRQDAFEEATRRLLSGEADRVAAEAEAERSNPASRRRPAKAARSRESAKASKKPAKAASRKKASARTRTPSIDVGALVRIGLVVAVLVGAFSVVRWFSSMTRGRGSVDPPNFAHILSVEETLLVNNRLTMTVSPGKWSAISAQGREQKVSEIVDYIEPKKITSLHVQDSSGRRLAVWNGRFITIMDY